MPDAATSDPNMSDSGPKGGEPKDAVPLKDLSQSQSPSQQPAATTSAAPVSTTSNPTDASTDAGKPTGASIPVVPDKDTPTASAMASSSTPARPVALDASDDAIEPSTKGKERASATGGAPPPLLGAVGREDSVAIGPSVDAMPTVGPLSAADGPVCNITLLLTTGARHPYRIDERYLTKRSVVVPGTTEAGKKDPFSISVYTLKELILREWRDEWDPKPASPSSIRLIHFGKLLDDKDQLKQYQFSAETANVVHMTVKPQDIEHEEEPKGGNKSGSGSGRNREGGGGCCVIL